MLFDSHVHFGQFRENYFDPKVISRMFKSVGVDYFAASSTSTCVTADAVFLQEERLQMSEFFGKKFLPILWVTPEMVKKSKDLNLYLDDAIKGLKIHGQLIQELSKNKQDKFFEQVFELACGLNLPLQIHTGGYEICMPIAHKNAGRFWGIKTQV